MRIFLDAHLHSKYSRATSKSMDLEHLASFAKQKGLNMLGTGDFSFPAWLDELKQKLKPIGDSGIFVYKDIYWILTTEVNTVYKQENRMRKVHHLIFVPDFEVVSEVNEMLSKYGDLSVDGRPTLKLSSPELVENLIEICPSILVIPAHCWTSWYGALGEFSGFNSLEECYQDQAKHVYALETGMSSDPSMNFRVSSLNKFTLVSFSDAHSFWTWRIGRENVCFDLKEISYQEIFKAIKNKDRKKILFTVETPPPYGRYHYTGHRTCGINLHPREAIKLNNICPKCGRKLTVGVLQRVEELADRPEGFVPKDAIPFKTLLPLYEIISFALGIGELYSKRVLQEHDKLIERFGNELNVLLNVPKEELVKVTDEKIADAIIRVREGKVNYISGYDGIYGKVVFDEKFELKKEKFQYQKNLRQF
ncbi:MAG: endonuclease Q family protein [Candidatus Aenigmarchaeota archaeon]|nr:endonuclease Q family protein [Candidatus Aenigmarchaeota archaeon]